MNIGAARVAAYQAVSAAVGALSPVPPVQWDNRNFIDTSTQVDPFLVVEFEVGNSLQKSLGNLKVVRYFGQIALLVCVKEGEGIAKVTSIADPLCLALGMKNFGGLITEAVKPQRPVPDKGWHMQPLSVVFWFDDIVTS